MWKFLGQHAAAAFGATAATLAMTQAVRAGRRAAHSRDANYMARAAAQQMRDDADAILNALPRDRRLMPWAESQIARGSDRVHSVAQALRFSPTRGLVQDGRAATFGVRNALEGPQRGRRAKKKAWTTEDEVALMDARSDYRRWAVESGRLKRSEYAEKQRAYRRMMSLEQRKARSK